MPVPRILVADDDKDILSTLNEHLSREGYDVSAVSDGEAAAGLIMNNTFEVVVLDIKMPKLNGFEVLKFVKKSSPATKVIMLTAYADLKNVEECRKLGADDVIEKPYDLGDLFSSIEFLLGR
jgi:DNA-binding response OmpR family regulator